MKDETRLHIEFCQKAVEMGLWDQSEADREIADCEIGLTPCTFSIWMRNPPQMALAWFELCRNLTWREVMEIWLDDGFDEKEQLRKYNHKQTDLLHKSGLIGA
jgi:hypothetical protein